MSERINYIQLLVGKRGCGKTTTAINLALSTGKNVLVLNTDNNDAYKDFKNVTIEQLPYIKERLCICVTDEPLQAMYVLNKFQKNLFIICDDTQKYISQQVDKLAQKFIINHRMNNFDLCFMYHSLKFVPPFLAMNFNQLVLFKTQDSNTSDLKYKYQNFDKIQLAMEAVKKSKSPYYCEIINDTDE